MIKVLIVGQTPPPRGGQAIMIEQLVNSQLSGVEMIHVRMNFSSSMDEVGRFSPMKLVRLFELIVKIIVCRVVKGVKILYYPPGGPNHVPMLRDAVALMSTRWMFQRVIFHFHASGLGGLYGRLPAWERWLFRKAYFDADAAIRLSELTPEDGQLIQARREFIVPYGIKDPRPEPIRRAGVVANKAQPLKILFVGVLHEEKGLMILVEACGKLAARGVPFHLQVMGQPESEQFVARVRARIEALSIHPQVEFLGVLNGDEKFAAFHHADVFCFPTFFNSEAFPVVLLEAIGCGLPVVSTFWRGIPSIVENGKSGLLVEPRDASAVADALETLAHDPQLRAQMGAAGRQKFLENYTVTAHLEQMRQVFLEVAGVPEDRKAVRPAKVPAASRPPRREPETTIAT